MAVSRIALAAVLTLCGLGAPAAAQLQPQILNMTPVERRALVALQTAAQGPDRAAQDAALAAARPIAQSAHARYALANFQFQIGRARGDAQMQNQAIDALVASGVPQGAELAPLLANQAGRLYSAGDLRGADRLVTRAVELQPNNPAVVMDHAQYKARLGDRAESVTLFARALQLQQATGQPAPEAWYKRALAAAFDARVGPQAIAFARQLVANYPTPGNWRDALLAYKQFAAPDPALDLDIRRLMRASGGFAGERDYLEAAAGATTARLPGEAKAILDEGVSRGMLAPTEAIVRTPLAAATRGAATARTGLARSRTQALAAATSTPALEAGDVHFGFGQYAEAAELYRAALQKTPADPNLVNSRLGAALALAGQRMEAEAALRAVTGPRADLAGFWMAWLSRRPQA